MPTVFYTGLGLSSVTYFMASHTTQITDAGSATWNTAALTENDDEHLRPRRRGPPRPREDRRGDTTRTTP